VPSLPGPNVLDPLSLLALAEGICATGCAQARERCAALAPRSPRAFSAAVLAVTAFPATGRLVDTHPERVIAMLDDDFAADRDVARYRKGLGDVAHGDGEEIRRRMRLFSREQKLRIALRELLPLELGGAELEVTTAEISDLAEALIGAALDLAVRETSDRFAPAVLSDGDPSCLVVLGMGKLAGRELNVGSDVDLVFVYDSDDGGSSDRSRPGATISTHDYWSRVCRRLTSILDEVTEDGAVWRVDLRLRPEGRNGPMVNSMPAMLRYYETWGRVWERAALMRARPVAGDAELGRWLLHELSPFVFRRHVDPSLVGELARLAERARVEASADPQRDVKLGRGGIRELELVVQSLQLVWGGVEPGIRSSATLDGLRRLWSRGLVTGREVEDLTDAWHLLRKVEHAVQHATGLQTHLLPQAGEEREVLARGLGFGSAQGLDESLGRARDRVHSLLGALAPEAIGASRWDALLQALEQGAWERVQEAMGSAFGESGSRELARDLIALAQRPDDLLGSMTRERHPGSSDCVLDAIADAADPEQAARHLRSFLSRVRSPAIHVSLLSSNPRAARRFIGVLGASAFVAELVSRRPELADQVPFSPGMPTPERARAELARELEALQGEDASDHEAIVGALRRARLRVTMEVALADMGEEVELRQVQRVLTELADASLERALALAVGSNGACPGFCVVAVGKLGGCELGYGSDLDVFFVFDSDRDGRPGDSLEHHARIAQKTLRLLSIPHADGSGYELDVRLRPSGAQGVLVSSLASFARYHGLGSVASGPVAAPWERQSLIRARVCAGDPELGREVAGLAARAAFELGPPDPEGLHRLRCRLEREVGRERRGRHDIKVGKGGLLDVEFAVQLAQMRHGADPRLRERGTLEAIDALDRFGCMAGSDAAVLREGYLFLRRLEQRLHVVHATSMNLLEEGAPGLVPLARRMGFHDETSRTAAAQLMERYRAVTDAVRTTYLRVLGV